MFLRCARKYWRSTVTKNAVRCLSCDAAAGGQLAQWQLDKHTHTQSHIRAHTRTHTPTYIKTSTARRNLKHAFVWVGCASIAATALRKDRTGRFIYSQNNADRSLQLRLGWWMMNCIECQCGPGGAGCTSTVNAVYATDSVRHRPWPLQTNGLCACVCVPTIIEGVSIYDTHTWRLMRRH